MLTKIFIPLLFIILIASHPENVHSSTDNRDERDGNRHWIKENNHSLNNLHASLVFLLKLC
jgi:hypothetical protein